MIMNRKSEAQYASEKRKYDKAYAEGSPLISDVKYDAFIKNYRASYPKSPELKQVSGRGREPLPIVVGSLELARPAEVANWMNWVEKRTGEQTGWLIEPKFDGLSVTLRYQKGRLNKAWSRGRIVSGKSLGFDVTKAMKWVQGAVETIKDNDSIYPINEEYLIRGEVIIHRSIFQTNYKDQEIGGKIYRNARNMAAGLLNRDNPDEVYEHLKRCTFIALQLFRKVNGQWRRPGSAHKEWVILHLMGFTTALNPVRYSKGHFKLRKLINNGHSSLKHTLPVHELDGGLGELAYIDHTPTEAEVVERMRAIHALVDIDCDGIVIQPIDNLHFQKLGQQLDSHPPFMRAVKLEAQDQESYDAKIGDIDWKVSKRGILAPRIVLDTPIEGKDATITYITANNAAHVKKWGLRKGRKISIVRSGDVIPRLIAVFDKGEWHNLQIKKNGKMIDQPGIRDLRIEDMIPKRCPACNSKLRWTETKIHIFCPNDQCIGRHGQNTVSFFRTLKVDEIAEQTILTLMNEGLNTVPKLLRGATVARLLKIEGFQGRKAKIVSEAIAKSLTGVPLSLVMHASGIFSDESTSLGSTRLQAIIDHVGEGAIARASAGALRVKLAKLHGAGKKTIDLFLDVLEDWRDFFEEIKEFYKPPRGPKGLAGIKVCWTGFRDPKQESYLLAQGGQIKSSVTKDTTVLFAASLGSGKANKADALNIPVVAQAESWTWLKEKGGA